MQHFNLSHANHICRELHFTYRTHVVITGMKIRCRKECSDWVGGSIQVIRVIIRQNFIIALSHTIICHACSTIVFSVPPLETNQLLRDEHVVWSARIPPTEGGISHVTETRRCSDWVGGYIVIFTVRMKLHHSTVPWDTLNSLHQWRNQISHSRMPRSAQEQHLLPEFINGALAFRCSHVFLQARMGLPYPRWGIFYLKQSRPGTWKRVWAFDRTRAFAAILEKS